MKSNISKVIEGLHFHMMPSLVDDMINQLNPDLVCHYCADHVGSDGVVENDNLYCCDDCADDHLHGHSWLVVDEQLATCHCCGNHISEDMDYTSDDHNLYCSDDCYFDHTQNRHDCTEHCSGGWYVAKTGST